MDFGKVQQKLCLDKSRVLGDDLQSQATQDRSFLLNQSELSHKGDQQLEGKMGLGELQQDLCLDNIKTSCKEVQGQAVGKGPCLSNQVEITYEGIRKRQRKGERDVREVYIPKQCLENSSDFDDGYLWRKYAQKNITGSYHPRSYFRCVERPCPAIKQVQHSEDGSGLLITYVYKHNCLPSKIKDKSDGERVKALADSSTDIMDEGNSDFLASQILGTGSQKHDDFPPWTPESPQVYNDPPAEIFCTISGTEVLLTLENPSLGESIFVGVAHHITPAETLQFYFFNVQDMAKCVGVGLAQAKVTLHNDLSITVEETDINDKKLQDSWMPLSDSNRHLVMKVGGDVAGMQAALNGDNHLYVQEYGRGKGKALSRLCGVGFDCTSQYVDHTHDAAEVSWPLLYDMALFILTRSADVRCTNETNEGSSAARGFGSNLEGDNAGSNMLGKLHGKLDLVFKKGNSQGGRDGDEDGIGCISTPSSEDDDPPIVLTVTVHPLTRRDILETQVKLDGLEGASIAPKLVFEFRRNHECKCIRIKTHTRLELASHMNVFYNTNLFGWYHTGIQISFGCEDTQGHPESGRVALLKQSSCGILNPKTSYKYTTMKSIALSRSETCTVGGQAGLKLGNALVISTEMQGAWSGARMHEVAASNGGNIETTRETICGGFSFRDQSSTEFPARASFLLFYPLDNVSIWEDREFLQGQGLFSTIEPSIEGTWIPLNGLDASPYLFKVLRSLKLHKVSSPMDEINKNQEYTLPFYVNHAMSHLKSQRSNHIELSGDRQIVPNVLQIGSAMY